MAKYFDKKLYYKGYYHNCLRYKVKYGPAEVIYDETTHEYIVKQKEAMDSPSNMVAMDDIDLHYWHRKRKSKYAVWFDNEVLGYPANVGYGLVHHLDDDTTTLIDSLQGGGYFIGIVNGITYYEIESSPKFGKYGRFIAKSKDGLYIESVCKFETDFDDRHFKASSPNNALILQEEKTIDNVKHYYYLKYDVSIKENNNNQNNNQNQSNEIPETVNRIELNQKIQGTIMKFEYPFVFVQNNRTINWIDSMGSRTSYGSYSGISNVYFIDSEDRLIDITSNFEPQIYAYERLRYKTKDISESVLIERPYMYQSMSGFLKYITFIDPYSVNVYTLCDGDFYLINIGYLTPLNFNFKYYEILGDEYSGPALDKLSGLTMEEITDAWYLGSSASNTSVEHFFKVGIDGSVNSLNYFESADTIDEYGTYKYNLSCAAFDKNYFYFTGGRDTILKMTSNFDVSSINTVNGGNRRSYLIHEFSKKDPIDAIRIYMNNSLLVSLKQIPVYKNGVFFDLIWGRKFYSSVRNGYLEILLEKLEYSSDGNDQQMDATFDFYRMYQTREVGYWARVFASDEKVPSQTFEDLVMYLHNIE